MPHHQSKRSQPVPAPARPKSSNKANRSSPGTQKHANGPHGSPGSLSSASGTSHGSPPHADASHSSKKLTKVIRGTAGGRNAKAKAKTRKLEEAPEAELSEDDDYTDPDDIAVDGVDDTREVEPSVPPSFIMRDFISTAKVRSDSHNISRGYEMITSPSARLVIPLDDASPITGKEPVIGRLESMVASISGLSDDSEWENIQFEMDGLNELVSVPLSETKVDYAAVLKKGGV